MTWRRHARRGVTPEALATVIAVGLVIVLFMALLGVGGVPPEPAR